MILLIKSVLVNKKKMKKKMVITILKPYFTGFISFINQILNDIKTFIFNKQPPPKKKEQKIEYSGGHALADQNQWELASKYILAMK